MDRDSHDNTADRPPFNTRDTQLDRLVSSLLSSNHDLFARGEYHHAYERLVAALHRAEEGGDSAEVQVVATMAREQARWLSAPPHAQPMGLRQVEAQSYRALWHALVREAEGYLVLLSLVHSSAAKS